MSGWVAGAVVVGGLASAAIGSDAARSASNAQARSASNAQQISQDQFNTIQQQNAPFTQSGYGALSALDWGLGISPQTANGAPANSTAPGYAPTGSLSQWAAPNGGGITGIQSGHDLRTGGYPGLISSANRPPNMTGTQGMPAQGGMGPVGGSGLPVTGGTVSGGQTGGLGYGSLTKAFDTSDWQQLSPAYNFQKQQGQQGVLNSDAAGQGALSGAAMKDLTDYNQSAANTSFNNAFNQYQTQQGNVFNRLSGIAQLGQASANNTGQQGTALAGQAAQSATNIGTAQAGGIVGSGNAWSGAISSAIPWLTAGGGGGSSTGQYGLPGNAGDWVPA